MLQWIKNPYTKYEGKEEKKKKSFILLGRMIYIFDAWEIGTKKKGWGYIVRVYYGVASPSPLSFYFFIFFFIFQLKNARKRHHMEKRATYTPVLFPTCARYSHVMLGVLFITEILPFCLFFF
ncbi:hypothetical protein BCR42DRAFT_21083 [Absidia repens]|uniref:Uncharacterized protein n=1 Tax=Absidia repens TaxID=90262 RepID=A0A1X2J315_9FUNG|nr:hypothetical protein BCR42DRAFT_21083 [Absidia repens]